MRDSADSDDYGVTRRGKNKRGKFNDGDARDATDGLPEGDRWSTWDHRKPGFQRTFHVSEDQRASVLDSDIRDNLL